MHELMVPTRIRCGWSALLQCISEEIVRGENLQDPNPFLRATHKKYRYWVETFNIVDTNHVVVHKGTCSFQDCNSWRRSALAAIVR